MFFLPRHPVVQPTTEDASVTVWEPMTDSRKRLWVALVFATSLVGMAPFFGDLQALLEERLSSRYVLALGFAFGLAVVVLFLTAVLRIRDHRLPRYSMLAVWLVLMSGQVLLWARSSAAENAVERLHFVFYGLVTLLFYRCFRERGDASVFWMTLIASVLVGVFDEAMQWLVPVRAADFIDIVINAYASFAGFWLGCALWPPERFEWRMRAASVLATGRLAAILVVVLALYIHIAHLGHLVVDAEIGRFRSYFSASDLDRLRTTRAERWSAKPPGPPEDLRSTEIEDYYRSEAGWRVHYREHSLRAENYYEAWQENRILERYFTPFLDLPNGYGGTFRLEPHVIARIEASRPPVDPYPYVSPVGLFPRHSIWLRPTKAELWVVATVLVGICLVLPTWTGRTGRASTLGTPKAPLLYR